MKDGGTVEVEQLKKRALIVIHIESCFPELLSVARMLKESGRYEPILLFVEGYYSTLRRDMSICEAQNIAHLNSVEEPGRRLLRGTLVGRLLSRLLNSFPESLAKTMKTHVFHSAAYQLWKHSQRLEFVRRLINSQGISLIVLGLDLAHYDTSVFIRAAHLQKSRQWLSLTL